MKTNEIVTGLLAAAVVASAVCVVLEHQARLRLLDEQRSLRQQLDGEAAVVAGNAQISNAPASTSVANAPGNDSRELLRLRGRVGVLRQQTNDLESVRQENRFVHAMLEIQNLDAKQAAATADYWPRDSWAFRGYDTPDAALQSSLWASNNGDLKGLLESATGQFREMLQRDLGSKSATEASIKAMDEVSSFRSVSVIDRQILSDDQVILTAAIEDRNQIQPTKLLMTRVGNGWKIAGPPSE